MNRNNVNKNSNTNNEKQLLFIILPYKREQGEKVIKS